MMATINYAQADLRFLLPIRSAQRVLVTGEAPVLIQNLQEIAEITTCFKWEDSFSLPSQSFDHVFVMNLPHAKRDELQQGLKHLLHPGGWGCIAVRNSQSLQALRFWKKKRKHSSELARFSFQECQRFPDVQSIYGLYDGLHNPQYFVPLADPAVTRFFLTNVMSPATVTTRYMLKVLSGLANYGWHYLLFREMVMIVSLAEAGDNPGSLSP